jgi:hypothetical protein
MEVIVSRYRSIVDVMEPAPVDTGADLIQGNYLSLANHVLDEVIHNNVGGEFLEITEKLAPADADLLVLEDSEDGFLKRKVEIGNLPSGGGGPDVLIMKATDELIANNTSVQDDDELKFSVAAGEKWSGVIFFNFTENGSNGLNYTVDVGSGTPAIARYFDALTLRDFGVNGIFGSGGAAMKAKVIHFTLDNTGGDATEVVFRWAQAISNGTATTVHAGSTLIAWKA